MFVELSTNCYLDKFSVYFMKTKFKINIDLSSKLHINTNYNCDLSCSMTAPYL